jgi:GDSL-like Lipase/Acylhydrolase family
VRALEPRLPGARRRPARTEREPIPRRQLLKRQDRRPHGTAEHRQRHRPVPAERASADATLVTLGNDLDFSGILTRRVELDAPGVLLAEAFHGTDDRAPCRTSYTSNGTDEIRQKIQAASVALAAALLRIHDLASHARVLVVGYPDLLPASDGGACARVLGTTSGDVEYLNNEELQLNRMLSSQATAVGDGYVDTYTPSIGHDACAAPSIRRIEPLVPAAPAAPMHPNAAGQQGITDAVERAIAPAG